MGKRRIVVGVVGPSGNGSEVYEMAVNLGLLLARHDVVLLSGGDPASKKRTVKDGALQNGARKVCIPPETGAWRSNDTVPNLLTLQTPLTNHERNVLTGQVPDALVALRGGAGTSSEVASALARKRPVVILGAWPDPQSAGSDELTALCSGLQSIEDAINARWRDTRWCGPLRLSEAMKHGYAACSWVPDQAGAAAKILQLFPHGVTRDASWRFDSLQLQAASVAATLAFDEFERHLAALCDLGQ